MNRNRTGGNVEFSLGDLAERLGVELSGDPERRVHGISALKSTRPGTISFLVDAHYRKHLNGTRAAAVILPPEEREYCPVDALISANPYLAYARLSALFAPRFAAAEPIHPSAVVDPGASLGEGVRIGAHAVIADGVVLSDDVEIGAGTVVSQGTRIGADSRLMANVTVYHDCVIGQRVLIQSGAVIGSDGFGFARDGRDWIKIHQLGRVVIGNDVEIGANTCVDRGAIEDTLIGDGVKLDNLIQVAHNVKVGARTVMAGCVGIAGSADIGEDCSLAGGVGVAGHLTIPPGTTVMAMSLVNNSLPESGIYASGLPAMERREWQRNAVRFRHLDDIARRLANVEKALQQRRR
jgi:UDP-3-O-[3-hydroxymyristoyl] glucosamine N-acyltransferase